LPWFNASGLVVLLVVVALSTEEGHQAALEVDQDRLDLDQDLLAVMVEPLVDILEWMTGQVDHLEGKEVPSDMGIWEDQTESLVGLAVVQAVVVQVVVAQAVVAPQVVRVHGRDPTKAVDPSDLRARFPVRVLPPAAFSPYARWFPASKILGVSCASA